jgi:hypothetical protein
LLLDLDSENYAKGKKFCDVQEPYLKKDLKKDLTSGNSSFLAPAVNTTVMIITDVGRN